MSMDSVKNVIDAALMPPQTDRLNLVDEVETPTNVMITVSAALEKKEVCICDRKFLKKEIVFFCLINSQFPKR